MANSARLNFKYVAFPELESGAIVGRQLLLDTASCSSTLQVLSIQSLAFFEQKTKKFGKQNRQIALIVNKRTHSGS